MYRQKYLKYKTKYLNLKHVQTGGSIVIVVSSDGQRFWMYPEVAKTSGTLKNLIEEVGIDQPIRLPGINGRTMHIITHVMDNIYHGRGVYSESALEQIRTLDGNAFVDLLNATNYLDFKVLFKLLIEQTTARLGDKYWLYIRANNIKDPKNQCGIINKGLKNVRYDSPSTLSRPILPPDLCYLIKSRRLYTFGKNYDGQLGYQTLSGNWQVEPKLVPKLENVRSVSCGDSHTAIIKNGVVYTCGNGIYGRLGHGNNKSLSTLTPIQDLQYATAVSCGYNHTAIIIHGSLYTFGSGLHGQLGHGSKINISVPTEIIDIWNYATDKVTAVSCGNMYTAVIVTGNLYTFGNGSGGVLGHGNENNLYIPTQVPNLKNVSAVSCGQNHTAVIADGQLYTFGAGDHGALGHGDTVDSYVPKQIKNFQNVTAVSCGNGHTAAISNGLLYTFGFGYWGQLGHGTYDDLNVPTQVPGLKNVTAVSCGGHETAVIANGVFYLLGYSPDPQMRAFNVPIQFPLLEEPIAVSCGGGHIGVIAK